MFIIYGIRHFLEYPVSNTVVTEVATTFSSEAERLASCSHLLPTDLGARSVTVDARICKRSTLLSPTCPGMRCSRATRAVATPLWALCSMATQMWCSPTSLTRCRRWVSNPSRTCSGSSRATPRSALSTAGCRRRPTTALAGRYHCRAVGAPSQAVPFARRLRSTSSATRRAATRRCRRPGHHQRWRWLQKLVRLSGEYLRLPISILHVLSQPLRDRSHPGPALCNCRPSKLRQGRRAVRDQV